MKMLGIGGLPKPPAMPRPPRTKCDVDAIAIDRRNKGGHPFVGLDGKVEWLGQWLDRMYDENGWDKATKPVL